MHHCVRRPIKPPQKRPCSVLRPEVTQRPTPRSKWFGSPTRPPPPKQPPKRIDDSNHSLDHTESIIATIIINTPTNSSCQLHSSPIILIIGIVATTHTLQEASTSSTTSSTTSATSTSSILAPPRSPPPVPGTTPASKWKRSGPTLGPDQPPRSRMRFSFTEAMRGEDRIFLFFLNFNSKLMLSVLFFIECYMR